MNYAEDRLDRRARHFETEKVIVVQHEHPQRTATSAETNSNIDSSSSEDSPLIKDWKKAIKMLKENGNDKKSSIVTGHELLGRTLRDVGWCRHAAFHYAMAWILDDSNDKNMKNNSLSRRAGDYAQMAEFAGFPELGVLALLHYRAGGHCRQHEEFSSSFLSTTGNISGDHGSFNINLPPAAGQHCGCGHPLCGKHVCTIPMTDTDYIVDAISEYTESLQLPHRIVNMPTANDVLSNIAKNERIASKSKLAATNKNVAPSVDDKLHNQQLQQHQPVVENDSVPWVLQFWQQQEEKTHDNYRPLEPVIQILLAKLLYLTITPLAAEAIAHMHFDKYIQRQFTKEYKSHNAYYVLMRNVLFGRDRIKPHRRLALAPHYHVPVWDVLFGKDYRCRYNNINSQQYNSNKSSSITKSNKNEPVHTVKNEPVHTVPLKAKEHFQRIINACEQELTRNTNSQELEPLPTITQTTNIGNFNNNPKPLFIVGDSHVLSIAWQTLQVPLSDCTHLAVPLVVTGIKAWHTRPSTRFFTHYHLHISLQRLPKTCRTILYSAGEIDCREGIGRETLEGYSNDTSKIRQHVKSTIEEYVTALISLSHQYQLQILVLPVAPHAYRSQRNGKAVGRAVRREIMQIWNQELKAALQQLRPSDNNVFFLDYVDELLCQDSALSSNNNTTSSSIKNKNNLNNSEQYVLDPKFNADYTHMNSAFLPLLEVAIKNCGCDMNKF
eukprot:CAMPEP_0194387042 /NCGR_PEP_ID=MMETSP0174-20130528/89743_1 /TAXON_ID=216777 /ORGANISM="Proboscia alata, Strain PI-D3" /LENGTH=721 /DNA_ID=CAMNT_0039176779 /DNA_START=72 /DNA_END=2237 /DNA_ORIENTATION=-